MKCAVCNEPIIIKSRKKSRPTCNKTSCNNHWTYIQRKDYYSLKHRQKYWKLKEERYEYVRSINRKAKSNQRYGNDSRELFIKSRGGKCENCGSTKYLVIHHIDNNGRKAELNGEKPNNSEDNLMVVCTSCHVGHHVWGWQLKMKTKSDTPSNRREPK